MKRFKNLLTIVMAATMIAATMTGCGASKTSTGSDTTKKAETKNVLIGSAIYKFDDTFMTGVRTAMEGQAKEKGATLELVDSQNKQPTQNEQIDTFITKGVNALAINPVDSTSAGPIIEKAKAKKLPIVFLNREP